VEFEEAIGQAARGSTLADREIDPRIVCATRTRQSAKGS